MGTPLTAFAQRQVSDIDRVEIATTAGRAAEYHWHTAETDAADARQRAAARAAHEAQQRQDERQQAIRAEAVAIIRAGPSVPEVVAASPARAALLRHLDWLAVAQQQAAAAVVKRDECRDASTRMAAALSAADAVDASVVAAGQEWIRLGSDASEPPVRTAERLEILRRAERDRLLAGLADDAAAAADLAAAVVEGLTALLPLRQAETVNAEAMSDLGPRLRAAADALAAVYSEIRAVEAATALSLDALLETKSAAGVSPPRRPIIPDRIDLPRVGQLDTSPPPVDQRRYAAALAAVATDAAGNATGLQIVVVPPARPSGRRLPKLIDRLWGFSDE